MNEWLGPAGLLLAAGSVSVNTLKRSSVERTPSITMPLLKRKSIDSSFIISIESGVEEITERKHLTSTTNEECDFLVNFITGEESLSAGFCCKLLYTLFRVCFAGEEGSGEHQRWRETAAAKRRSTYRTI